MSSTVKQLNDAGQSVWYDNLSRQLLLDGTLYQLVANGEITGVTTNPAILNKAFTNSDIYDQSIKSLGRRGIDVNRAYEFLVIEDIRLAADMLHHIYESSRGQDGFVSVEVSPHLADDSVGTIKEATELFTAIGRPNILIKVPATPNGIDAIRQLIAAGINVNATLLFAVDMYKKVMGAYLDGLEQRVQSGKQIATVTSVASFFVSRWDSLVDGIVTKTPDTSQNQELKAAVLGQTGIALGQKAYLAYQEVINTDQWLKLAASGAQPQKLLFASTGTKNPNYSDVYYVEGLIAPGTVTTLPPKTLDAFRDHGKLKPLTPPKAVTCEAIFSKLKDLDIDLALLADDLLQKGLQSFIGAFDDLIRGLDEKLGT